MAHCLEFQKDLNITMKNILIFFRRCLYIICGFISKLIPIFGPEIIVLCYHSIGNDSWRFTVTLQDFSNQMDYLSKHHSFISAEDLKNHLTGKKVLTKNSVLITFDDGYKDILQVLPITEKYHIKPVSFALSHTKKLDYHELGSRREYLRPADMKLLLKKGWTIGSHSATHPDFSRLTKDQQEFEILNSKIELEKQSGQSIDIFSFPKGRYTTSQVSLLSSAGYQMAFLAFSELISPKTGIYVIPRIGVDGSHSLMEFTYMIKPLTIIVRGVADSLHLGQLLN